MRKRIRELIRENRWLKGVPTLLTIFNSLCGFAAILFLVLSYDYIDDVDITRMVLTLSSLIILGAMIFDVLDGFTARLFNAASMHGMQMDSLADMVTFGLAPALMVAVMAHRIRDLSNSRFYMVVAFCSVYLACAALRLATYNVHAMLEKKSSEKFNGLPSPGAAAAICSVVIFYGTWQVEIRQIVAILPVYTSFLGLLMISPFRYQHMGRWLLSLRRNNRRIVVVVLVLLAMAKWPALTLLIMVNGYVLSGPVVEFMALFRAEKSEEPSFSSSEA